MAAALLSVEQALLLIQQQTNRLPEVTVPLRDALGLRLAADAVSDVDSPPHDKAMMDGYAVAAEDTSAERTVLEEVVAGSTPSQTVRPGTVTRIMTGAPLPAGAAAVVPVELTELINNHTVRLPTQAWPPGKHVMPRGEAFAQRQVVAQAGQVVTAAMTALLAETGHASVEVVRQPTVAILATGDELVDPAQTPGAGQIRNSNGPMLQALVAEAAALATMQAVARDEVTSLTTHLHQAQAADVVLLSGGVSAGTRDLAPSVLAKLGVQQVFHKVAVKPGKPIWFGVWAQADRQTLVFGLPGNPVSSFVCFQLFVLPALAAMSGGAFQGLLQWPACLQTDVRSTAGREAYLPARLACRSGEWQVSPTAWRGSADLLGLAQANALLQVPAGKSGLSTGNRAIVRPLGRLRIDADTQNS